MMRMGKKYIWAATTAAAIEYKIEYKRQVVIAIEEDRENPIFRRLLTEPTNERTFDVDNVSMTKHFLGFLSINK